MFATVLRHRWTVHNKYFFSAKVDSQVHLVQRFGGQCSIIDFCIVSPDLFSSVVDVRVKREAKLSTDHHLSRLHSEKPEPSENKETIQSTKSIQNKVGVTSRQKGEAYKVSIKSCTHLKF